MFKELSVSTNQKTEFIDITGKVQEELENSGVKSGFCTLFIPHTTAGVTINENADPSVKRDILMELNKIIPFEDGYHHNEGNSAAHIKSSLTGVSLQLIAENGKLKLGTWQGIYFCEYDGPRRRKVWVKITEG
ncbi:MAG: secondary thiamine-phosphate synthase enzyme YjbQ [Calditrichia bacterium]